MVVLAYFPYPMASMQTESLQAADVQPQESSAVLPLESWVFVGVAEPLVAEAEQQLAAERQRVPALDEPE